MAPVQPASSVSPAAAANERTAAPASNDFWQRPFVRDILPFITSLSLHATLIIIGLLMYTAVQMVHRPMQLQIGSAEITMPDPNEMLGVVGNDPVKPWTKPMQDKIMDATADGASSFRGTKMELSSGGGDNNDQSASVFATGPGSFGRGGHFGPGNGPSDGSGDGEGLLKRFGVPSDGGVKHPTFIDTHTAKQVVFLCDATGSMLNKMATLKDELNKAVVSLRPVQSFDIIFYQGTNVYTFSKSLSPATPENKRKAGAWLEGITAQDITFPVPALETAIKLHPELIHFLTDAADFPDTAAVVDTIKKYNGNNAIKINTILFVEDKTEREKNIESEVLMKKIATENGGKFRWVEMDAIQQ